LVERQRKGLFWSIFENVNPMLLVL
jgi:hypothetical protein